MNRKCCRPSSVNEVNVTIPATVAIASTLLIYMASLAFFLMPEPREPPEMKKLCVEDGKNVKVPRVVILPCVSFDVAQVEFAGTDGQLAEALARQMMTQCEDSQEKLTVVPWVKVKEYLSRHPNWKVECLDDALQWQAQKGAFGRVHRDFPIDVFEHPVESARSAAKV